VRRTDGITTAHAALAYNASSGKKTYMQGRSERGIKGFILPKLPKLDLTTDAEYVTNSGGLAKC